MNLNYTSCPLLTVHLVLCTVLPHSNSRRKVFSTVSFLFSHSVVFNSLWPQPARLPYPSLSPAVCSNSCPLSRWCHSIISSSVTPFSSCPQSFPALGSFPNESALRIRWPKYWSCNFSISPSSEYSELISFRIDWFPCCPRDSQESSPAPQFKNIRSSITVS